MLPAVVSFDYWIRNLLIRMCRSILFSKINDKKNIKKILVFRTGSIGDNICALPAFSAIRTNFPNAHIDILTNSGKSLSVGLAALIDTSKFSNVIDYSNTDKKKLLSELKKNKYDLFIELPQYDSTAFRQIRNQFVVKLMGIKHAFGWKMSQTLLFPKFQEQNIKFKDERVRLLDILKENAIDISTDEFIYTKNNSTEILVKKIMLDNILENKATNVGIVIGSNVPRNKWPIENFNKVSEHYLNKGFNILFFGGQEDKELVSKIALSKNMFNFCGVFTPLETAEAMKYCSVVITNDTGPMHLSYMVNTPVVALFSSRDFPEKWYPPTDGVNKVFRSENISCSICFSRSCSDNICLKKITPEEVIAAADNILKSTHNVRN